MSILLLMALPGCVPVDGGSGKPPLATDPGAWEIAFGVSGGIAGIRQQLNMKSSGELSAADLRRDKQVALRATPAQVTRISGILSRLSTEATPPKGSRLPGRCRDCFNYSVEAVVDGRRHRMAMNSMAVKNSQYAELVGALSVMLKDALADKGN